MEKSAHVLGGNFVSVVGSRDGRWASIRDVDGDFDGPGGIAGVSP